MGWLGVVALVACGLLISGVDVFPGYAALWPTGCAVLVLVAGHTRLAVGGGPAARGPSGPLPRRHQLHPVPVALAGAHAVPGHAGPGSGRAARWHAIIIAISVALAVLTHHLVEKPAIARGLGVRVAATGSALCSPSSCCSSRVVLAGPRGGARRPRRSRRGHGPPRRDGADVRLGPGRGPAAHRGGGARRLGQRARLGLRPDDHVPDVQRVHTAGVQARRNGS